MVTLKVKRVYLFKRTRRVDIYKKGIFKFRKLTSCEINAGYPLADSPNVSLYSMVCLTNYDSFALYLGDLQCNGTWYLSPKTNASRVLN